MSTLVFHVWAIGVFWASSKKTDFLVQNVEARGIAFKSIKVQNHAVESETFDTYAVE